MAPRLDATNTNTPTATEPIASPPRLAKSTSADEVKLLKNRPNPSKLRQQKLPAWQPILTAYTAIPVIFAVGFVFIPIGVVLLIAAQSVKEWSVEYSTICLNDKSCSINFTLNETFPGNVYFYYGLDNYFQNHRRYVKSRSDKQLLGVNLKDVADCAPLDYLDTPKGRLPIAPCGAIANSMFNDTFTLYDSSGSLVPFTTNGVVWEVDRTVRFRNPHSDEKKSLCDEFEGTVRPPNWQVDACQLDPQNSNNSGFKNVDFIVWMRTAALPSFRKLYRLLDRDTSSDRYKQGLPSGSYTLKIGNNYPVKDFHGKKSFIISTTAWSGGRNTFLGVAYIVIGGICVILGAIFTIIHVKYGHSFAEMADISTTTR